MKKYLQLQKFLVESKFAKFENSTAFIENLNIAAVLDYKDLVNHEQKYTASITLENCKSDLDIFTTLILFWLNNFDFVRQRLNLEPPKFELAWINESNYNLVITIEFVEQIKYETVTEKTQADFILQKNGKTDFLKLLRETQIDPDDLATFEVLENGGGI